MIRFVSILIAILLFGQSLNKTIVYLNYLSSREYIVKNLCENRDKPEMHCNGKCHLQKQLDKQDGQIPNAPKTSLSEKEISEYEIPGEMQISLPVVSDQHSLSAYLASFSEEHSPAVFHPPLS